MRPMGSSDKPGLKDVPRTPSVPPSPGGLAHPLYRESWGPPARLFLGIPSCFTDGEGEAQSWTVTQTPGEHWLLGHRVGTHGAPVPVESPW